MDITSLLQGHPAVVGQLVPALLKLYNDIEAVRMHAGFGIHAPSL